MINGSGVHSGPGIYDGVKPQRYYRIETLHRRLEYAYRYLAERAPRAVGERAVGELHKRWPPARKAAGSLLRLAQMTARGEVDEDGMIAWSFFTQYVDATPGPIVWAQSLCTHPLHQMPYGRPPTEDMKRMPHSGLCELPEALCWAGLEGLMDPPESHGRMIVTIAPLVPARQGMSQGIVRELEAQIDDITTAAKRLDPEWALNLDTAILT